jgi:NAD(P)H-nitrite reductase large subunit
MSENEEEDIIICRCEEITKSKIIEAIKSGATTVAGVKRRTRGGMGLCQGRTCSLLITRLIAQYTGQRVSEIFPARFRPPVRPVEIEILAQEE